MEKKIKKIAKITKNHKIIIYGAGKMAKEMFENYDLSNLNIIGVCDKGFKDNNKTFYGYPCLSLEDLKEYLYNDIYITAEIWRNFKRFRIKL